MKNCTVELKCPYCGGKLDVHERFFTDEGIKVTCFKCCDFQEWYKDMEDVLSALSPNGVPHNYPNSSNSRTRSWRRHTNFKKAIRKRNIDRSRQASFNNPMYYYKHLHQYSKNKVHCSCPICSSKTKRNPNSPTYGVGHYNYKASDLRKITHLDQSFED